MLHIKASNLSKTTQDLRNLFFSLQVYEIKKFPFQLFSAACNIALGASTLRRNSCKTRLPQKKYLWQNPFKVHIKLQAVYSVVYSTAEVFRHHRVRSSHRRCSVKRFPETFLQLSQENTRVGVSFQ